MLKKKIKKFSININKKIIDVLKKFDKNRNNFLIVINSKNQFEGVITISDVRRALVKGNNVNQKIKKFININPVVLKFRDYLLIKEKKKKLNDINIDPFFIPVLNKDNIPVMILNNLENLNKPKKQKRLSKKSVLIIGGAGYIGSVLTGLLLKNDYTINVLDKFIYQSKFKFTNLFKNKKLNVIDGDTRDIKTVFNAVKNNDIVIHLGEMVGDPLCEKEPELTLETNYLASISIANICKTLEISKFVYISSCSVYGANKTNRLLDENSEINPVSSYAKLKIKCEEAILNNIGNFCKTSIIRLGTVFGDSPRKRYDLVVNLFSGLVANNKKIKIFGGEQWRPFIHVSDVSNFIKRIIENTTQNKKGEIYNLIGENIKIYNLGKYLIKKYNANVMIEKRLDDKRNYKVTAQKAYKTFNFKPKYTVKKGIEEIILNTKKNKINNIFKDRYINISNLEKFR